MKYSKEETEKIKDAVEKSKEKIRKQRKITAIEELIKKCEDNGGHHLVHDNGNCGCFMSCWYKCTKCPYIDSD